MPKIILTRDDVAEILVDYVLREYEYMLDVHETSEVTFNDYNLPYGDLVFEKKVIREVKLEDVEDMVIEQLKTAKQEG